TPFLSSFPTRRSSDLDLRLWSFLAQFMAHASDSAWDKTMEKLTPIDKVAHDAFDELELGEVDAKTHAGPFVIGFQSEPDSRGFFNEITGGIRYGPEVDINRVEDPQSMVPILCDDIQAVYRLEGQRFIEPGPYVEAIAKAVKERGGEVIEGKTVESVEGGAKAAVVYADGSREEADKVVVA